MRVSGAVVWLELALVLAPTITLAQDKVFDSNGVSIRYVERGKGEPIVLVHGYAGTQFGGLPQSMILATYSLRFGL